jgi:hypothetical protein
MTVAGIRIVRYERVRKTETELERKEIAHDRMIAHSRFEQERKTWEQVRLILPSKKDNNDPPELLR